MTKYKFKMTKLPGPYTSKPSKPVNNDEPIDTLKQIFREILMEMMSNGSREYKKGLAFALNVVGRRIPSTLTKIDIIRSVLDELERQDDGGVAGED